MQDELILASASPRRSELLKLMGIHFEVIPSEVDENVTGAPDEIVLCLAERKARAVAEKHPGRVVLASDTVVFCDGAVFGKPHDEEDAFQMLSQLQNNKNEVWTGVCVIDQAGNALKTVEKTDVYFDIMSENDIRHYIACGEPMDKAGAYGAQDMGGMYVKRIDGSMSNVIGLPMHVVKHMLEKIEFNF